MVENFSTEEKLRRIRHAWPLWVAVIAKAVDGKYGEEGRKVIMDALRHQGSAHGEKVVVDKMKPERSIQGIAQTLLTLMQVMGIEAEIKELSQNRFAMRIDRCPLSERWKIVGAPSWMCELWGSYALGMYQSIHPKFEYKVLKSIHRGDPYCEEIWELKE